MWSFGSRLILRWLWRFLLSIRKRLVYRSVLRWGWFASILIHLGLLCLLFFMFLFPYWPLSGIDVVQAQSGTETPTPPATWEPLFPTSTPEPTRDSTCGGIQPVGWGTVTPDPDWLFNCSLCVTPEISTPMSSATPMMCVSGTMTAVAPDGPVGAPALPPDGGADWCAGCPSDPNCINQTATPTPVLSPTITLTPTIQPAHVYRAGHTTWTISLTTTTAWSEVNTNYQVPTCGVGDTNLGILTNTAWYFTQFSGADHTLRFRLGVEASVNSSQTYIHSSMCSIPSYPESYTGGITRSAICAQFPGYEDVTFGNQPPMAAGFYSGRLWLGPGNSVTAISEISAVCFGSNEVPEATATPIITLTPTSTPIAGYCKLVNGTGSSGSGDGSGTGITLPYPMVGDTTCIQIGGFTISLGWIGTLSQLVGWGAPADIAIPGFLVCWKAITFGVLQIFGLSIDLDWIAFAMAGIAAIRIVSRS